jgi:hypothetical protein
MAVYHNFGAVSVEAVVDNVKYRLGLSFMNGYPRFVVFEDDGNESKLFASITFNTHTLLTVLRSIQASINGDDTIPLEVNSLNHKYVDDKRTEELESRGIMVFEVSGDYKIHVSHKGKEVVFEPLKGYNTYIKTNKDGEEMKKTAIKVMYELLSIAVEIHSVNEMKGK